MPVRGCSTQQTSILQVSVYVRRQPQYLQYGEATGHTAVWTPRNVPRPHVRRARTDDTDPVPGANNSHTRTEHCTVAPHKLNIETSMSEFLN